MLFVFVSISILCFWFCREKADRPFRCLDCQYRRELVRVYLTNVEQICRRFVEESRSKLGKLIEDKARWPRYVFAFGTSVKLQFGMITTRAYHTMPYFGRHNGLSLPLQCFMVLVNVTWHEFDGIFCCICWIF